MEKCYKTACRGCHGGCLFDLTVEDGKVTKARPSKDGPLNHGRGCVKGMSIIEQMYHPDRLTYPMKRAGARGEGKWERITWDEAYDYIATKLNQIREESGPEAISSLTGTGRHHLPFLARLDNAIGTPNNGSVGALICMAPRCTAAEFNAGLFAGVDYYGDVKPGGILVWGTNPAVSGADGELQWNIKDAVRDGMPLVVVDPKRTELAQKAQIWLRVRPGTDGALALGILNIIIEEELYDQEFVAEYSVGLEELKERCRDFPLEKVSRITDIDAETIYQAAHWIASVKPLALEQGCAFEQGINALDTSRAIHSILAITGNYDVPGGFVESMDLVPAGVAMPNEIPPETAEKVLSGPYPFPHQRGIAHPYFLLESIRTGKPYRTRGLLIHANNTLMTMADSKHTYESLKEIEFMVYMDVFMNPTAELADIVLPAALWPEVDCVFAMPEFGDQVVLSQQKLVQVGECKTDEEFFMELCKRAGWNYGYTDHRDIMEEQMRIFRERRPEYKDVTLDQLREQGYLAPQRHYYQYKERGFRTPTGKYEFASTTLREEGKDPVPNWVEPKESPVSTPQLAKEYPLILTTGGRHQSFFVTNNRQILSLRKREPFPFVRMHPDVALQHGMQEGDWAYIESPRGRITQKVKLDAHMNPSVVNCDYGWWYPEAGAPDYGWSESNANVLTSVQEPFDPYMGSYEMRGLLCKIYPNPDCKIEERFWDWVNRKEAAE